MFSGITNIYERKTKRPTLMELFTATGKLKKFFLTTRDVRCVHHGWHGTHRYDTQVLTTHTSTWVHRYSSLLQWSVPLGQRGHVAMVPCVLCTKCTLHRNRSLARVIFQHTKRLLPPNGHFFATYARIAQRQKCELRWKTTNWGKKNLNCSFYLYRFRKYVSYDFPIIIFCNLGVHYETPCMFIDKCLFFIALLHVSMFVHHPLGVFMMYVKVTH